MQKDFLFIVAQMARNPNPESPSAAQVVAAAAYSASHGILRLSPWDSQQLQLRYHLVDLLATALQSASAAVSPTQTSLQGPPEAHLEAELSPSELLLAGLGCLSLLPPGAEALGLRVLASVLQPHILRPLLEGVGEAMAGLEGSGGCWAYAAAGRPFGGVAQSPSVSPEGERV